jgi:hypothetical protein
MLSGRKEMVMLAARLARVKKSPRLTRFASGGYNEFTLKLAVVYVFKGDVAEQADAKVSKTFEITSRVGSIPTIPITSQESGIRGRESGQEWSTKAEAELSSQFNLIFFSDPDP